MTQDKFEGTREEYMRSKRWDRIVQRMIDHAGGRCERCGSTENLTVHHKTYERLGHERVPDDLQVLCASCHYAHHKWHLYYVALDTWAKERYGPDWGEEPSRAGEVQSEFDAWRKQQDRAQAEIDDLQLKLWEIEGKPDPEDPEAER